MDYDLLVRGGTIVDGTGSPRFRGNVAVAGGRIVGVGDVDGSAKRVIDADGRAVAPGFVGVHTHSDAHIFWDPILPISAWPVAAGAGGFGRSPSRPAGVEGGRPGPSRVAARAGIEAIGRAFAGPGCGVVRATFGPALFLDGSESIARKSGRPVSWTALLA